MIRLIKANFYNLFKTRYFYILLLLSAVIGAGLTIGFYYTPDMTMPENADIVTEGSNILAIAPNFAGIVIPFLSAAAAGLFLESEYTQGTIRNKIICGFERSKIFFSQFITVCAATVIYFAVYEAAVFGIAVFAFDFSDVSLKAAVVSLGVMLLMIIAVSTSLSLMIGGFVHGGKLIVILLGLQYAMEIFLVFGIYKEKVKIFDYLSRIAPQGSMFYLTYNAIPDKIGINFVISLILIAVFVSAGFFSFRKSDIV